MANESKTQKCVAKLGEPSRAGMRVCGESCVYLTSAQAMRSGNRYSGWYHVDPTVDEDHWPVPESMVR